MSAPALEKGLEILELLVGESEALTLSQVADRCGRSVSEIQRMVRVLHGKGYLDRTEGNAYRPGLKLYELGKIRHPFRHLQTVAEPVMATLADEIGHSIHLSVEDCGQMLILSEIKGSGIASVSLKTGSYHPLEKSLSGRILLANHPGNECTVDAIALARDGYLMAPSQLYEGIYDMGVFVRSENVTIPAVLACSWLKLLGEADFPDSLAASLSEAGARIGKMLR